MKIRDILLAAGAAAFVGLSTTAATAVVIAETEPNNSKANANTVGPITLANLDQITGTTNSATTDPDYFRIRSSVATPGIYLHTLSTTVLTSLSIRGVNHGFVAGDVDFTNAGAGRSSIKYYTVGASSDNFVRVARTSGSGAQTYTVTMNTVQVVPTAVGTFNGPITIDPALVGDSELFLYDSNFNLVAANDNRAFGDGRALLNNLALANGTYYIAVGSGDSAANRSYSSDTLDPFFSGQGTGFTPRVLDPFTGENPAILASTLARPENLGRSASDYSIRINGGSLLAPTNGINQAMEMAFFSFEVIPAPSSAALLGLGALALGRRRR